MQRTTDEAAQDAAPDAQEERVIVINAPEPLWRRHPYLSLFIGAFLVRSIVVFVTGSLEGWVLDDTTYSRIAEAAARGATANWDAYTRVLYDTTAAFTQPLTLIYRLLGPNEVAGQLYVAAVGAGVAPLVARVARVTLPLGIALVGGVIIALLPSQVIWSAFLMKDASVWLTLSGIALMVVLLQRSESRSLVAGVVGAAALLYVLGHLREHTLVVAAIALLICGVIGFRWWGFARSTVLIGLALVVPWLVGVGPAGLTLATNAGDLETRRLKNAEAARTAFIDSQPGEETTELENTAAELQAAVQQHEEDLNDLRSRREGVETRVGEVPPSERERLRVRAERLRAQEEALEQRLEEERRRAAELVARAQSGRATAVSEAGPLDPNLRHLPKGIFVMLLEPTPWGWSGSDSQTLQLARLESILWYPLLVLALIGIPAGFRRLRAFLFPMLVGGGVLVMYALTEGNIGTAYRHRGEFVWVVAMLGAAGAHSLMQRRGGVCQHTAPG